jgi:hypothetical protein
MDQDRITVYAPRWDTHQYVSFVVGEVVNKTTEGALLRPELGLRTTLETTLLGGDFEVGMGI